MKMSSSRRRKIKPGEESPKRFLTIPELEQAIQWLHKLDWFMPEPGLCLGDTNEDFLGARWPLTDGEITIRSSWAIQRSWLFLSHRASGSRAWSSEESSGIDWLSAVSAEWKAEGRLYQADLEQRGCRRKPFRETAQLRMG